MIEAFLKNNLENEGENNVEKHYNSGYGVFFRVDIRRVQYFLCSRV